MPRKRGSTAAGISDLPRIAGGINENGGNDVIARVFPRKTAASPTDELAFFGEPTIDAISTCIRKNVREVHISVTFTYDLQRADDLYEMWQVLGVPVEVGGPAFDDRMGDFTPGMYLRDGLIFTSRGCTKDCWFCSVPRCAHGTVRELEVVDGWNIMDDNILGTSERHFKEVCEMLKREKHPAVFSGGLEPSLLQQWQADLLREVKPARIYTAYDTKDDLEPLVEMGRKLRIAGFKPASHTMFCYVLIGYDGDSFSDAEKRMIETVRAGFIPFAMLFRDADGEVNAEWRKFQREWCRQMIVCKKFNEIRKEETT